jgi:Flp pilus assembly pilin Flp
MKGGGDLFLLIRSLIEAVRAREEGQGLTEYALILALILVGVGALLVVLNTNIQNALNGAINSF